MLQPLGDPIRYAPVTRIYRHWLAWAAALLLHMLLIGMVASRSWLPEPPLPPSRLDVVLVTQASSAPQTAEAIADAHQRASGSDARTSPAERRAAAGASPASPGHHGEMAARDESVIADPLAMEMDLSAPSMTRIAALASQSSQGRDSQGQAAISLREQGVAAEYMGPVGDSGRRAARQAAEADYIDTWTRQVEEFGNRFSTAPAHLDGQLRIRVVLGREGQLLQAEVIQSSGHSELDQAALDTVHGAAPYRPFDPAMAGLDSLSITRVWRFGKGNNFGVQ